jgi:hypothetical protein
MSLRRAALHLLWCALATSPFASAQAADDVVLISVPKEVRKTCLEVFPGYRTLRVVMKNAAQGPVYRVTVFAPDVNGARGGKLGDDYVWEMLLYDIEILQDGSIVEESRHPIAHTAVPAPVLSSFRQWNPRGVTGMGPLWAVERERGKERIYLVDIPMSAVLSYVATFKADGTIVQAKPARVP